MTLDSGPRTIGRYDLKFLEEERARYGESGVSDRYRDYIKKFLKQEADCLADVSDRTGDEQHVFHSSGQITEVEQRFLEIMSILNRICLDIPAGIDLLSDDAEISRVDQHWRAKFPPWFSGIFIVRPPKDDETTVSRHEIFTRWLSDFSIENRYCFYVGHKMVSSSY